MERAYGVEIPQTLAETCNPRRTALLVYDMQLGIIGQIQNGQAVVARVKDVLDAARAAGLRVFFATLVTAEGGNRSFSTAHGNDVAKSEHGCRCEAVVPT
jgi:nicotinamidase-related amidase